MMRHAFSTVSAIVASLIAVPALAQEYSARLGRVPVDSRTRSEITGLGSAAAELDGDRLEISGEFEGLLGSATAANLHMGPAVGVRGPVIHALSVTAATGGELEGSVRLTADQLAGLRAGRLYVRIDSETAPDGNLWGWLLSRDE